MIAAERDADDRSGRIILKMNNVVDTAVIDALYEASQAGVRIDLVIRSICCLRPGVPGMSDGIRVRSLVGRFLEHSRILAFGERRRRCYYIGSADLMPRNLDRRSRRSCQSTTPSSQARLQEVLDLNLSDDTLAWEMDGDGTWRKAAPGEGVNAQHRLQEIAFERSRRPAESSVT